MISILLVDDHAMVREGLRQLLETDGQFHIVAEACSGEDGFREYFRIKPDVMILDLSLSGEGGLATLRRLHSRDASAKVLILSMFDDVPMMFRALDCGAKGYLSKSASHAELKKAIKAVNNGKPYIEQQMREKIHQRTLSKQHPSLALTTREFEVFNMLADGKTVIEIAELLHLSPKTAGAHHTNIMKKLQLKNSAQLVRTAIMWGLVKL